MLNHNFLTCAKAETGLDSLYCGEWEKISKSQHHLDLNQTMPNVELVRQFNALQYVKVSSRLNHYILSYRAYTHTHTHTHTRVLYSCV